MVFPVSIIIPTLNSAKTLGACISSIVTQDFPTEFIEIIFADGGSTDTTLAIIDRAKLIFGEQKVKYISNKLKTGEAGKAAGLKNAAGEIVAFIDSDNILDDTQWLKKMLEPFKDQKIVASEPIRYTYRSTDSAITRYCALMGMNDPLCFFLGNYDRECILSGKWTQMPYKVYEDNDIYTSLGLEPEHMPTIGANGFLMRRKELESLKIDDYLFDIDALRIVLDKDKSKRIAKVKTGIVHIFCGQIKDFIRKQKRRIADYRLFKHQGIRKYNWQSVNRVGFFYFVICCLLIIPLIYQAIKGYCKSKDSCMFLHPVFCLITLYVYATGFFTKRTFYSRTNWQAD